MIEEKTTQAVLLAVAEAIDSIPDGTPLEGADTFAHAAADVLGAGEGGAALAAAIVRAVARSRGRR